MTDAELSISDATLIARLRSNIFGTGTTMLAADRIELLATTNEQLVATNEALSISNATLIAERDALQSWKRYWSGEYDTVLAGRADEYDRAEAAEAKLAKAVEALEFYAYGHAVPPSWQRAHSTLAEIRGENHDQR